MIQVYDKTVSSLDNVLLTPFMLRLMEIRITHHLRLCVGGKACPFMIGKGFFFFFMIGKGVFSTNASD